MCLMLNANCFSLNHRMTDAEMCADGALAEWAFRDARARWGKQDEAFMSRDAVLRTHGL